MIIDSHCHLVSHKFEPSEIAEIVTRAEQANVTSLVTLATNLGDAPAHLKLAETYPNIYAGIGIHPCDVSETPDSYMEELEKLASHQKCVVIGETGLDYFHPAPKGWTNESYRERQRHFLNEHFALAAKLNKNIVLHTRDKDAHQSFDDCIEIYSKWADQVQAVFHCFLGPIERAEPVFKLGGIISFTGISTFKSAKDCSAAAQQAPEGTFMLETDSPYLAPAPYRGKRCEPAHVLETAKHIAASRNETLEKLTQHTTNVAKKFYKI